MVGDLNQSAGQAIRRIICIIQLAQLAQVHRPGLSRPGGVPPGTDIVHQLGVDRVTQRLTARRHRVALAIVDDADRAARVSLIASDAVGVPGDVHRILAGTGVLPAGVDRPRGDVARRLLHPHALGVVEGRHLPPGDVGRVRGGRLDAGQVVEGAPAEADRVGDDHLPGHTRLVGQRDPCLLPRQEAVAAQVVPGVAVDLLVDHHLGGAAGVMDHVVGVDGTIGALPIPGIHCELPVARHGGRPDRSGRRRAGHGRRPMIAGVGVPARAGGRPSPCLRITHSGTVVYHSLRGAHVALADRDHRRAGVPQVAQQVLVHRLGVVVVLDDGPDVRRVRVGRPLGAPGVTVPLPAVSRADVDGPPTQRSLRLALPGTGRGGSTHRHRLRLLLGGHQRLLARHTDWRQEVRQRHELPGRGIPGLDAQVTPAHRLQGPGQLRHQDLEGLVVDLAQRLLRHPQAHHHRPFRLHTLHGGG